jgi:RND family efflux transporter MFP subunit
MSPLRRLASVVALAGPALACARGATPEKAARPVRVESVRKEAAASGLRYSASIQPYAQVTLAFKVGGYVRELLQRPGADGRLRDLQQGDAVRKGTVLARITETDYREKALQARAQIAEAELLYQTHSVTRPDYDAARASRDAAQARTEAARAQLAAAEIALHDCALAAPIDAVVLSRQVEVGQLAAAGTVGFVIADLSRVKAVFGVPDTLVERVRTGMDLPVTTEAIDGIQVPGRITAVAPSADTQSRVFAVEVTIPNPQRQLKAGMIAAVAVEQPAGGPRIAPGALTVPIAAIVKSPHTTGGYGVFLAEGAAERTTARARDVGLGAIAGNRVAVISGLAEGDRVIVSGPSLLTDGDPVRVIPGQDQ